MDARKRFYLEAMDIPVYVSAGGRPAGEAAEEAIAVRSTAPTSVGADLRSATGYEAQPSGEVAEDAIAARSAAPTVQAEASVQVQAEASGMDWEELERTAKACVQCALHETRGNVVFGVGDRQARWMVVGEAPGADEDRQGEPFVGRAGRLLNSMLEAAGAPRERVYIANILKCRPPGNRDPKPDEAAACRPFLDRQIELVRPDLIIAVGRIAAQHLLGTDTAIGKLRGTVHRYGERAIPVVATYHPAYLLRSPGQKRRAWDDLKLAMRVAPATGDGDRP